MAQILTFHGVEQKPITNCPRVLVRYILREIWKSTLLQTCTPHYSSTLGRNCLGSEAELVWGRC